MKEDGRQDAVRLAVELCDMGYCVTVREGLGGGQQCLSNLRHTFLIVAARCAADEEAVIVEPYFRDHFEVAKPCSCYLEILTEAPSEFVGSRESLFSLVRLLSYEIAHHFSERGMRVPPWRQLKGILSKWFPANAKDTEYGATARTAGSPEADDTLWVLPAHTGRSHHVCCGNQIPFSTDLA